MFGHHRAQRAENRLHRAQKQSEKERKEYEKGDDAGNQQKMNSFNEQAKLKAAEAGEARKKSYEEGRQRAQNLFADPSINGLDPKKREAMQFEANKQAQRSMQSSHRKLLGDQATHGIVGKGGIGYGQQGELLNQYHNSEANTRRDLDKLDADQRLKNIAAILALEQGEASQGQLDYQSALDELYLNDERGNQRKLQKESNRQFNRI